MEFRNIAVHDHAKIISVVNEWSGGRDMVCMLPRLFFVHFCDTSFIVEENGELAGFLFGFVSQSTPEEAYVHFAGVNPNYRKQGIGVDLYSRFISVVQYRGCKVVRCITSPTNKASIAFHKRIGFEILNGDKEVDGIPVTANYDSNGGDRVIFHREIGN